MEKREQQGQCRDSELLRDIIQQLLMATDLTIRDHFAGLAMQDIHTNPDLLGAVTFGGVLDGSVDEKVSRTAYRMADAMLAARKQNPQDQ